MSKQSKYTIELERRFGKDLPDKKKSTLAKFFDIDIKYLDEVYDRGMAAGRKTGMRSNVKSLDQWGRARMTKFILNVVAAKKGQKINTKAGQDGDVVIKALGNIIVLKKPKAGSEAKYVAKYKNKSFNFGNKNFRDYILMNDKNSKYYEPDKTEREKVKSNYQSRHKNDKLKKVSRGSLSYYLLWNEPTLKKSIADYEKRFDVKIII